MPAPLPGATAFTYAVELSAEDDDGNVAPFVSFNDDLVLYVTNFLDFPVGHTEPFGTYDRAAGHWVAERDGLVIKMLDTVNGLATLDFDGDDLEDPPSSYDALEITDEERYQLTQLYPAGTELWRVTLNHFTPGDLNLGFELGDECAPGSDPIGNTDCSLADILGADPKEDSCTQDGSIIECQNQTLGQRIPVTGTPFALHYQSDRTPGFEAARRLEIPVTNETTPLPPGVERILVEVEVAGRRIRQQAAQCPCPTGLNHEFIWDGKDAWGRTVQGPQEAIVRIGYAFFRFWKSNPFNLAAEPPLSFGSWPSQSFFSILNDGSDSTEYAVWTEYRVGLGTWNSVPVGLGGFSLDVHHAYSPAHRTLYLGDGRRRTDTGRGAVINYFAGGTAGAANTGTSQQEGAAAEDANVGDVAAGMDVGSDGTLFFAVQTGGGDHSIASITPAGTMHYLTNQADNFTGCQLSADGPAGSANLCYPRDVAVGSDGSVYVAERGFPSTTQGYKIRKIEPGPNPTISTVAGTGQPGPSINGMKATEAPLNDPTRVAVGPSDSIFLLDTDFLTNDAVVRRVSTAGKIYTVAGGGSQTMADMVPPQWAWELELDNSALNDIEAGPDGSLFIAENANHVVYRVWPDGSLAVYAGTYQTPGSSGDYGPANQAELDNPSAIHVTSDGTLYIAVQDVNDDSANGAQGGVRRVAPNGVISTVVGGPDISGSSCQFGCGVPGPATEADLGSSALWAFSLGPNGDYYVRRNKRIFHVRPVFPGGADANILVPSRDGQMVYEFDQRGQHQRTLDALTGVELLKFDYTDGSEPHGKADLLWKITDVVDGHETVIAHDAQGNPDTITGPFNHQTDLANPVPSLGFIQEVTPPGLTAGAKYLLAYDGGGLLTDFTEPAGNNKKYYYSDAMDPHGFVGLLEQAETFDPVAVRDLERTNLQDGHEVTFKHALNPSFNRTVYKVLGHDDGSETWTVSHQVGTLVNDKVVTTTERLTNGGTLTTLQDETTVRVTPAADPRFLMQAPVPAEVEVQTGGKTLSMATERSVTLTAPGNDPLSVANWTQTTCVNGDVAATGTGCVNAVAGLTTVYAGTPNTITQTTNAGRDSV